MGWPLEHEYSVLGGVSRAQVGRYLSVLAAMVSGGVVFVLLQLVDIANAWGIPASLPPSVLSLVGAGAVFAIFYKVLDRYAWRWNLISAILKVPNLSGDWACIGNTQNLDKSTSYEWSGTLTIVQSWDRIRVRMRTQTSSSNSMSAALMCDSVDGYKLFYSYKNDPGIAEVDLSSHRGFAEITFKNNLMSGDGEYFNGYGRYTFGTMSLKRIERDAP